MKKLQPKSSSCLGYLLWKKLAVHVMSCMHAVYDTQAGEGKTNVKPMVVLMGMFHCARMRKNPQQFLFFLSIDS